MRTACARPRISFTRCCRTSLCAARRAADGQELRHGNAGERAAFGVAQEAEQTAWNSLVEVEGGKRSRRGARLPRGRRERDESRRYEDGDVERDNNKLG